LLDCGVDIKLLDRWLDLFGMSGPLFFMAAPRPMFGTEPGWAAVEPNLEPKFCEPRTSVLAPASAPLPRPSPKPPPNLAPKAD